MLPTILSMWRMGRTPRLRAMRFWQRRLAVRRPTIGRKRKMPARVSWTAIWSSAPSARFSNMEALTLATAGGSWFSREARRGRILSKTIPCCCKTLSSITDRFHLRISAHGMVADSRHVHSAALAVSRRALRTNPSSTSSAYRSTCSAVPFVRVEIRNTRATAALSRSAR